MSVIDKITDLESKIAPILGATCLSDPANNIADPLVQIAAHAMGGQQAIEDKLAQFISGFDLSTASCECLDIYAAYIGESKRANKASTTSVIASGAEGSIIPKGTKLVDNLGNDWTITSAITISGGIGSGHAESPVGDYLVQPHELSGGFPAGISAITSGVMIESGYAIESCEQFRARLSGKANKSPNTESGIIEKLKSIATSAKFIPDAPECTSPYSRSAFVVEGGSDLEVAGLIAQYAPLNYTTLAGDVSATVYDCETVRFMRPCYVGIQIEYWGSKAVDDSEFIAALCGNQEVSALSFAGIGCVKGAMIRPIYPIASDVTCTQPDAATACDGSIVSLVSDSCHCTGTDCATDFVSCLSLENWQSPAFVDAAYMGESC